MPSADLDAHIDAVRRFNRLYTRRLGLLREGYLDSPHSLSEVRVLYELAHRESTTANLLAAELGLDAGYLSRILRRFQQQGLIEKQPSPHDGRQLLIALTGAGEEAVAALERRSREDIARMLEPAAPESQQRLVAAMRDIETALDPAIASTAPVIIRTHRPGDMGWIVSRHGALYAQEYGWDSAFEAVVARIAADFIERYDPSCEHCWIAERDGVKLGSVALVRHPERPGVAKLRLLLVEPAARGLGVGRHLVETCIHFARQAGYHTITLWTYSHLTAALRIYERAGFRVVEEEAQQAFGQELVEQTWELAL
ncbi:MAG: helix-turn-helix domain-containing GNAT family N-acetyltransferase [Thermomicrobiales bacterium]